MMNFLQPLLFLSVVTAVIIISTCSTIEEEILLECDVTEYNNSRISNQTITLCTTKEVDITSDQDTKLLFKDIDGNNYTGLMISDKKIPVFPHELLQLFPHGISLGISFSHMKKIEDYTFRNGTHLLELDFRHNELTEVTEFTFFGAYNLLSLNLDANDIEIVSPEAFHDMPKLKVLSMATNQIAVLDKDTFRMLKNLNELNLNRNRLVSIHLQLFTHNEKLSELDLGRNRFEEIEMELSARRVETLNFCGFGSELKKLSLRCE